MLTGRTYSPLDYAWMAWRRRWILVVPVFAGVFASLLVSSRLADQYQSETLIQIVPQQVPNSYVQSTVTMKTEDRLNALRQQVLSRTELERLIVTFNLYPGQRERLPMQDVVELMRENTTVEPVASMRSGREENTDAFYIRYKYTEPAIATQVTQRLGSLFIDQNARDRGALAEATDDFLQTQLAEARKRLEEQEDRLEKFREENAGRLPSQLAFNMQAIQNAQMQLQANTDALARDRDRKLMLERLNNDAQMEIEVAAPPSSAAAQQQPGMALPAGATLQQKLAAARAYLTTIELTRKAEHPDVIRAKRVVTDLEKQEAAENAAAKSGGPSRESTAPATVDREGAVRRERLAQMRAEMESLDRQIAFKEGEERRLQSTIVSYQQRVEAVPGTESEWTALSRDYDTQQAAYKDLLSKSEQARVATNLERRQVGEQFRILDPARVPTTPVGPKRLQITAIGTVAGLALGVLLAGLLELRDSTFRTELDVVEVLSLPVVAVVPYVSSDADLARARRRRLLFSTAAFFVFSVAGYVFWSMKLWRYAV
jgi:polysaccharide chain length determinant protein (PEP-CTERM system associated)